MAVSEFELIGRFFNGIGAKRADVPLGIGDDAALLQLLPGRQLVVSTDTLVCGQHFLLDDGPRAIASKAVAVNLSDLAAMGAEPAWILLSLTLPQADESWLAQFAQAVDELCQYYGVALVGGDTTRGPLSVSITVMGQVAPEKAIRRDQARPGDGIFVSGTLGGAAAGLAAKLGQLDLPVPLAESMINRLHFPKPRLALGQTIRDFASSALDLSDGLISDIGHILKASQVDAIIDVDKLPLVDELRPHLSEAQLLRYALSGGDDYELCFTVPEETRGRMETALARVGIPITCIGQIRKPGEGRLKLQYQGQPYAFDGHGFDHFLED